MGIGGMANDSVVIIGAGQGGFQAAASLRQDGFAGRIVLIGEEAGLPYQRPPLSKAYLKDGDAGRLSLRPAAFYEQHRVELLDGRLAVDIDRDAQLVRTDAGESIPYGHLILATGSRNVQPPIAGIDTDGIQELRTLRDAAAIRARLVDVRTALVIGGGFIGLEFAAVARGVGIDVTVIEAAPRLMARAVSPEMSRRFATLHQALGTRLVLGQAVTGILSDPCGQARGVRLADGSEHHADMLLLAAGVRPNTDLAARAGLAVDNGILVDTFLQTSDPSISALGDCAAYPDARTGRRIRLESVQAATDHARTISRRLMGSPEPYTTVPWFWSDQADWKLQIAGLGQDDDTVQSREGPNGAVTILRFAKNRLVCVETVNAAAEHMAARRLLAMTPAVTREEVENCPGGLGELLKTRNTIPARQRALI